MVTKTLEDLLGYFGALEAAGCVPIAGGLHYQRFPCSCDLYSPFDMDLCDAGEPAQKMEYHDGEESIFTKTAEQFIVQRAVWNFYIGDASVHN